MDGGSFLIIGAQKAGTTTLYRDLYPHPDIFLPTEKEPNALCEDAVLTGTGRRAYLKLFSRAKPSQIRGEASTHYSMLPDYPGVPRRAKLIWGKDLRVIYLVRDPITRILSQHQYESGLGLVSGDINDLVRSDERFISYSKYSMQIAAWLDVFPPEQIKIVCFERYIRNRAQVVEDICEFLGARLQSAHIDEVRVYNRGSGEPVATGVWRRLIASPLYKNIIKPVVPLEVRDTLRWMLLPRSTAHRQQLSDDTKKFVYEKLGLPPDPDADHDYLAPAFKERAC